MKKLKLMSALLLSASLAFTGCSFNQAIGNVDEKNLSNNNYMMYKGSTISKSEAVFNYYIMKFQEESSKAKAGQLTEDYWTKKVNDGKSTNEANFKKMYEDIMKRSLALKYLSVEKKISLTEDEKESALEQAKYTLGQTYKNALVEYFEMEDVPLTEKDLYNYNCSGALYEKMYSKLIEEQSSKLTGGKVTAYDYIFVDSSRGKDEASKIANKILEDVKTSGKSIEDVARENSLQVDNGYTLEGSKDSNVFPKEVNDKILSMKKDEIEVMPLKSSTGESLVGYVVLKVTDVNSDKLRSKIEGTLAQKIQKENLDKKLVEIESNIKINKSVLDNISNKSNTKFWERFYPKSKIQKNLEGNK